MILKYVSEFVSFGALSFILFNLFGCSSGKTITADNFSGYSEIDRGDTAKISWYFKNATSATFEGISKNVLDSALVAPVTDTEYRINAFSPYDTLSVIWKVIVNSIDEDLDLDERFDLGTSYRESQYLSGIDTSSDTDPPIPEFFKIMGYSNLRDSLQFHYLVLDRFGNFIQNYSEHPYSMEILTECNLQEESLYALPSNSLDRNNNRIKIIIDDSGDFELANEIIGQILSLDILQTSKYSWSIEFLSEEKSYSAKSGATSNDEFSLPESDIPNLNNSYSRLFNESIENEEETLIIYIANQNDNSSLIFTPEDVKLAANSTNTRLFNIQVGNSADPLPLRYISHDTGGAYYLLEQTTDVGDIVQEIILSLNYSFTASIHEEEFKEASCPDKSTNFKLENSNSVRYDKYQIYDRTLEFGYSNQILALFDEKSSEVKSIYESNISRLVTVLKDNPDYNIELVGHSSIEGNSNFVKDLAMARAISLKEELQKEGIQPERIKLRSLGQSKPIYSIEATEYQKLYNRRVEVRWLTPDSMPYEVFVNDTDTEQSASAELNKWRERGYRVYYDRFMESNQPVYKIILWGYKNLEEAKAVSNQINDLYSLKSIVK